VRRCISPALSALLALFILYAGGYAAPVPLVDARGPAPVRRARPPFAAVATGVAAWSGGYDYYNLRAAPRAGAPRAGKLHQGDSVDVLGSVRDAPPGAASGAGDLWYRLRVGAADSASGKPRVLYALSAAIGYLRSPVTWTGVTSDNGEQDTTVVYSLAAPRPDAAVEASFALGARMTVLGTARGAALEPGDDIWYRVATGSYRPAYVYSAYLKWARPGLGPVPLPVLAAAEALAVDLDTMRPLYSRDPDAPRAPASLVKMMTAAVALDHFGADTNAVITTPAGAPGVGAEIGGTAMGLTRGERLSLRDLLYGMLLPSGNDAAYTIADAVAGGQPQFAALMNAKAAAIGLKNTRFAQGYGLDAPGQVSTAWDLARLARYNLAHYPLFDEIVRTPYRLIGQGRAHRAYALHSTNKLLGVYPGLFGVKTGTTPAAGQNLVVAARRGGLRVLVVIMGSTDRYADASALLDYAVAADSR